MLRFPELRPPHQAVFQHIDHPPEGTRLTTLAYRSGLSKQALIEVIDDMEKLNFVERFPDPTDRRAKLIRLTPRGMSVHEHAYQVVAGVEREWSQLMGDQAFEELKQLLARLSQVLQADARHG